MSSENMTPEVAQTSAESSGSEAASVSTTETASKEANVAAPSMEGTTPAVPSWQPNYKFKAYGKEQEIEPMFRSLIKDQETEKQIRKFHEKAYALEPMQAERDRYKTEYETFKSSNEPTIKAVAQLNKLLQNKDYENFFKGLKISDDDLFNYVNKKLEVMQLPPDQRADWEKQNQIKMQNYQLENQYAEMESKFQSQMVQTRTMELGSVLSRSDVSSYAQTWDQKAGQIGAFRDLIIDEAKAIHYQTGQDMSAEQAVNHVIQKFGKIVQPHQGASSVVVPTLPEGNAQQSYPNGNGQAGQRPPIIPNVTGRGTSPVKKSPKSLEDLRALAKTMQT